MSFLVPFLHKLKEKNFMEDEFGKEFYYRSIDGCSREGR